jgi:two-component system phosphate regulon sensor histidine kinase PhoR
MKFGVRTKFFIVSVLVIMVSIIIAGFFLAHVQQNEIFLRIQSELKRHAVTAKTLVETVDEMGDSSRIDGLADRLGKAIEARITIVDRAGRVMGDSTLSQGEVRKIENHRDRPEIKTAFSEGYGQSRRFSTTAGLDMLYVAVRYQRADGIGVVRVSKPLSQIDEAISKLLGFLVLGGLIALIIAAFISALTSHFMSKSLRSLVDYAHQMADGQRKPIPISTGDELGGLASSINRMSEQIGHHLGILANERDRFEAVLEGMSEAVVALDEDRRITLVNQAGIALLGLDGQPLGRSLLETIRIPELHKHIGELGLEEDSALEFELPGTHKKTVYAHTKVQRSGGVVIVFTDVTEVRRLETVRRDFVANVSHELRTPVSIIRANAETLLVEAPDSGEPSVRFMESILGNAERLSRLISDLLDISRIESGGYKMEMHHIEAGEVLRRAANTMADRAKTKNLALAVESSQKQPVLADGRALDQIVLNLLDNAVKYTQEGGHIVVRAIRQNSDVFIEVEDNGPGIKSQHRDRLFERFYRVDSGRSKEMGGTGLGLAIVKHLASAMGGNAGMRPARPRGSVFWISLKAG